MKRYFLLFCVVITFSINIDGQRKFEQVPVDEILVVIIPQLNSPLKVEDAVAVRSEKGIIKILYHVRNVGEKAITDYTIAKWYSNDLGSVGIGSMPKDGSALEKNNASGELSSEIPITKSKTASKKNSKTNPMIAFVFIAEITFSDGSSFSDTETFKAFDRHMKRIRAIYDEN